MIKYAVQRLLQAIPVLFGISLISFGLIRVTPGDPAEIMLRSDGIQPSPEAVAAIRAQLGLDEPLFMRNRAFACQVMGHLRRWQSLYLSFADGCCFFRWNLF
ncbi:hypothetical protein ACHHV8_13455 [Paenibacillus sp. TAB 01]|uniref:hypothetical protein n=1 Tax=Paenibacillus sp. TAB 01 TaxID=3368988 RepID=UPI003750CE1F